MFPNGNNNSSNGHHVRPPPFGAFNPNNPGAVNNPGYHHQYGQQPPQVAYYGMHNGQGINMQNQHHPPPPPPLMGNMPMPPVPYPGAMAQGFIGQPGGGFRPVGMMPPPPGSLGMPPMMAMGRPPQPPNMMPSPPSIMITREDDSFLGERFTTLFVGTINLEFEDEIIFKLLCSCGEVKKWNRVKDVKGVPKAFGFCDYLTPDSLIVALHILSLVTLNGKPLLLKIDDKASSYLERFKQLKTSQGVVIEDPKRDEFVLDGIKKILSEYGKPFSIKGSEDDAKKEEVGSGSEALVPSASGVNSESSTNAHSPKQSTVTKASDDVKEDIADNLSIKLSTMKEKSKELKEEHDEEEKKRIALLESLSDDEENYRKRQEESAEKAYYDRLRRWESYENQMIKAHERDILRESERVSRAEIRAKELSLFLSEYDDDVAEDEYQTDRTRWFEKRKKEKEREQRSDEDDRKRAAAEEAAREAEKRKKELLETEERQKASSAAEVRVGTLTNLKLGFGLAKSAVTTNVPVKTPETSVTPSIVTGVKRERPKAVEAFGEDEEVIFSPESFGSDNANFPYSDESNLPIHKKRRTILPVTYTRRDLIKAGYSDEEADKKLKELDRELIQKIAKAIPVDEERLFRYPLSWEPMDEVIQSAKIAAWIEKKIAELLGEPESSLVEYIVAQLRQRPTAEKMQEELARALGEKDAKVLILKLWRFIIFETEYSILKRSLA